MTTDLKLTLPFYFVATKKRDNDGFPQTFPFHLFFDNKLDIYRQKNSQSLKKILDKAYLKGSMLAGGMNDSMIGDPRVNEAYAFIKNNFPLKKSSVILEIGCGEGQVLKLLAQQGIQCVGLEPGPQVLQIKGPNLSVIKDFFPSKKIEGKYDLILHFGVLEHIAEPLPFLKKQKKYLTKDGAIIFAVPNCKQDLDAGDISVFLHQHYNYFTTYGINKLAEEAGFTLEKIMLGNDGAFIYAKLVIKSAKKTSLKLDKPISDTKFKKTMQRFNKTVINYFKDNKQSDIAVYCPLRSMNFLFKAGINDCRLIDDNINLQGKCLPTFKRKIESFDDLKKNPPRKILIYSRTFGKIIKKKCRDVNKFSATEIHTIDELNK